ncbi:hypothetical protein AADG42_12820 [Ammonicoccus fulvus]|uniref:NTP pyrophosphohydrolase n=1 Tax=Ammonicoccus fulvus TaxID=3138240 RepID=A0ABZ3FTK4_9ACTN
MDDSQRVLVVDAANVVGSVPDGWWRDRAGAAARVYAGLAAVTASYDRVVFVLEGKARAGVPEGTQGSITTVHAAGEGDDEIVAQCRSLAEGDVQITLATADRGLIARVASVGVRIVGPRSVRS